MKVNIPKKGKPEIKIDKWDYWDIDIHIARILIPLLKELREKSMAYPPQLSSYAEWDLILSKILFSCESLVYEHGDGYGLRDMDKYEAICKRRREGFELLGKYFQHLGD